MSPGNNCFSAMNKLIFLSLGFIVICGICSGQHIEINDSKDWELSKDKDGIQIYNRSVEGSKLKEFLGITRIHASKETIIELINDVENKPSWMSNLASAKIIEKISDDEHIDYYESEIPWPIKNKDIVMRFKLEQEGDSGSIFINYWSVPDYIPEKENISRLKHTKGYFKLTSLENGITELRYLVSSDPEIKLPAWALNKFMVEPPFQTLYNLRRLGEKVIN